MVLASSFVDAHHVRFAVEWYVGDTCMLGSPLPSTIEFMREKWFIGL